MDNSFYEMDQETTTSGCKKYQEHSKMRGQKSLHFTAIGKK